MQFTAHKVSVNGREVTFSTNTTPYYLNQITSLKGKLKVTVKEYKETKTQRQNSYAWALFTKISLEQNGSKRQEDVERVYHYVLQRANVDKITLFALAEIEIKDNNGIVIDKIKGKEALERIYSVVHEYNHDIFRQDKVYHEFDCYIGISKFDVKQMQELIDTTIDYGVELGIPFAELDNMKGAYDL